MGPTAAGSANEPATIFSGPLSVSAMKMELEQLKKDNGRLKEMLKNTKEYSSFADFVEDSGGQAIRVPSA